MHRRVNVTLPEETIRLIERVAPRGDRSRLIDRAVRDYVSRVGRANLKRLLKEAATHRAESDLEIAQAWFPLEEEAWSLHQK